MAKAATDGIQKVYVMRPTREDQIRETAVRLFIASPGADPKEAADRAIERAIAFEEVWRQAKETGRLEAPQLDDELFTP